MLKEKLPAIGKALSLLLLVGTIAVVVTAFIRARKTNKPAGVVTAKPVLPGKVTTIVEGYKHVETDGNGREKFRLLAAKDTGYDDGRHELEKVDLTSFGEPKGGENGRSMCITSDRGSYLRDQNLVTFEGNVKITSSDGMEVTTEFVRYEQQNQIANTDRPVQFRQGGISGSSVGANLNTKAHTLVLEKAAHIISAVSDPKKKNSPPVEIRGDRANYAELDGVARFEGNVNVVQGERAARADLITGVINVQTKMLDRIEMRNNSSLKTLEKGKASELTARDVDLFFDEAQRLKAATANGRARAVSLEKDSPREIVAEKIDAGFKPNEKSSDLQTIVTGGRTTMKIEVAESATESSERVIEADGVQAVFHEDGKNLQRAEANGNAVLTVTPKQVTPKSEKKRLRAPRFNAEFFATGNAIKIRVAEGGAVAEFEPMVKESKLKNRTLSGKK
ncbi:MAG: LPS export ABC transporter periplasmic protein LptC, partial [Blastocatellia bacterium]